MLRLPNGNSVSDFKFFPTNWDKLKGTAATKSIEKNWYIYYRFYEKDQKPKQVMVKGTINRLTKYSERVDAMRSLIDMTETELLGGFNPNDKKREMSAVNPKDGIPRFIPSMHNALNKITVVPRTKDGIRLVLTAAEKAAKQLGIDAFPINEIGKKHLKELLEKIGENKGENFSANNYNVHKKYLSILFTELEDDETIEENPILRIKKRKTIRNIRETLSPEERKIVTKHLTKNRPEFWRFLQAFFHGGCRITEILKVQGKHVNLKKQTVAMLIQKDRVSKWENKTIKDIVLPYWKEAMKNCGPEDYVFSKSLVPGKLSISPRQISRRWKTQIKDKFGIKADFYALKHLHTEEVSEHLGIEQASLHNSHTNIKTTLLYANGEAGRKTNSVKQLNNPF